MGTTFAVNGVNYNTLSTAVGRYALDPFIWTPSQKIQRFHVNGVAGNFTVLGGATGGTIQCRVRYVSDPVDVYAMYETDVNAMIGTSFSVISPGTTTYTRCKLTGSSITFGPRAINDATVNCYMDAALQITCDGGAS